MTVLKKAIWKVLSQPGELRFHKQENDRCRDDFMECSGQEFTAWGFRPDDYAEKTVMDIGCGSKLRTLYFTDAKIIALDPLADKFIEDVPWCNLTKAAEVYSLPTEKFIDGVEGRVDLLVCMNVLDHCFDTEDILRNMDRYLAVGGKILLSVDVEHHLHHLHPNLVSREFLLKWFDTNGYIVDVLDASATPYGMGRKFTMLGVKQARKVE